MITPKRVKHPKRLVGMAVLPMQAPEPALQELTRASLLPSMCGLDMGAHIHKQNLEEKAFYPVCAKCSEPGWPDAGIAAITSECNVFAQGLMRSSIYADWARLNALAL